LTKEADEFKKLNNKLEELSGQVSATSINLSSQVSELSKKVQELTIFYNRESVKSKKVTWKFFWYAVILGALTGGLVGLLNSYLMEINASLHVTALSYGLSSITIVVLLGIVFYYMWQLTKLPIDKIEIE